MITADKFNLFNATEDDVIRLNQALAYLQSDQKMAKVVQQVVDLGIPIVFDNGGLNSMYVTSINCGNSPCPKVPFILWDSFGGGDIKQCVEFDNNGKCSRSEKGTMSPASVLGHEMGHATDPNYYENVRN